MIPQEVAQVLGARGVADGRWRGKCPAHDGRSHNSLSIQAANDGKTLVKCWGGCPTEDVLVAGGLAWSDLFPPSSSPSSYPHRRIDPIVALQQRAQAGLRDWKEKTGRAVRDRVWRQHRLITEGERRFATGRKGAWELLGLGYQGLSRLEWLADLLDSRRPQDWLTARHFLKGSQ